MIILKQDLYILPIKTTFANIFLQILFHLITKFYSLHFYLVSESVYNLFHPFSIKKPKSVMGNFSKMLRSVVF